MPTIIATTKLTVHRPPQSYLEPAVYAARLDREADFRLQAGYHREAERLAMRAAELRGDA